MLDYLLRSEVWSHSTILTGMCNGSRCPKDTKTCIASSEAGGCSFPSRLHMENPSDICSGTASDPVLVTQTEVESSTHPHKMSATSSDSENEGVCSTKKELPRPEVVKLVRSLGALNLLEGNIPGESNRSDHSIGTVGSRNFHSKGLLHIEFHESVDQMVEGA